MNIQDEFSKQLDELEPILSAFGNFVVLKIEDNLREKLGQKFDGFLKIPCVPRVKEKTSALSKILRKNYNDPLKQMTDLVGIRFVVLFKTDLKTITDIIESTNDWVAIKSRDYEEEVHQSPEVFDYQSVHYEVRPKIPLTCGNVLIDKEIVCEVQVRTLLQHAYAEAVHDSIYKPKGNVPSIAKRYISRSMALMETTDDLFCQTMLELEKASSDRIKVFNILLDFQENIFGKSDFKLDEKINYHLIDVYKEHSFLINKADIESFFNSKPPKLKEKIRERADYLFLYTQPCIFMLYYLIDLDCDFVRENWPFHYLSKEISMMFSDLGFSYE